MLGKAECFSGRKSGEVESGEAGDDGEDGKERWIAEVEDDEAGAGRG